MFGLIGVARRLREKGLMGIGRRNADYVLMYNPRKFYPRVDDKLITKNLALAAGLPVPELYAVVREEHEIAELHQKIAHREQFVVKPAHGSGGDGILVITGRRGGKYRRSNGSFLDRDEFDHHLSNMLSGLFSLGGQPDHVLVEYCVQFDPIFDNVSYKGVPDIRIIVFLGYPVMGMIRLPTRLSDGKANLHQGAIGVGIDIPTGTTRRGVFGNEPVREHPDTEHSIVGLKIPRWDELLLIAARAYELSGPGLRRRRHRARQGQGAADPGTQRAPRARDPDRQRQRLAEPAAADPGARGRRHPGQRSASSRGLRQGPFRHHLRRSGRGTIRCSRARAIQDRLTQRSAGSRRARPGRAALPLSPPAPPASPRQTIDPRNPMATARALLSKLVLVLVTGVFALGAGVAAAQKKDNPYPNAKRAEPRTAMSEASAKKFNASQEAMDEADYAKAKESLQSILDNKRASPYERAMAMTYLANVAWEEDDMARALDYNQQAIALDAMPNEAQFNALYQVAQMYLMDEKYAESLATLEQWFAQTGSESADAWALKGNALYRLDKFAEAAQAIERANQLATKPNDAWNQMLLASYMEGENYAAAATAAEGILAKNPQDKDVTLTLASIYNEMEQNDKALAVLEGAYQKGLLSEGKDLKQLYQMYNYLEQPAKARRGDHGRARFRRAQARPRHLPRPRRRLLAVRGLAQGRRRLHQGRALRPGRRDGVPARAYPDPGAGPVRRGQDRDPGGARQGRAQARRRGLDPARQRRVRDRQRGRGDRRVPEGGGLPQDQGHGRVLAQERQALSRSHGTRRVAGIADPVRRAGREASGAWRACHGVEG